MICFLESKYIKTLLSPNYSRRCGISVVSACTLADSCNADSRRSFLPKKDALLPWVAGRSLKWGFEAVKVRGVTFIRVAV